MTAPLWPTVYLVIFADGAPIGPDDDSPHYAAYAYLDEREAERVRDRLNEYEEELGRDPEWRVVAFVERGGTTP